MDLDAERSYLAACSEALHDMIATSRQNAAAAAASTTDAVMRDVFDAHYEQRLAGLIEGIGLPLFFGALERTDEKQYVGRRGVRSAEGDTMVMDWRAQASQAFYRATATEPDGVLSRRRFGFRADELTAFEDEDLTKGQPQQGLSKLVLAEIERPRSGPMRDIVATIQADQDFLVRAGLDADLAVQGGPGTGKTAVGLHRAAYLMFAHRRQLQQSGVLVVGPNDAFVDYIRDVLPALGEGGVTHTTVERLVGAEGAPVDPAAEIKYDVRMAAVLARHVEAQYGPIDVPLAVKVGSRTARISIAELQRIRAATQARPVPYEAGRVNFRERLVDRLIELTGATRTEAAAGLRGADPATRAMLAASWPQLRADRLLRDLLTGSSTNDLLTDEEWVALRLRSKGKWRWTRADHVLLDELGWLLERGPSYGHVVVDEVQDLSPMQLRAIARRRGKSVTLLGDLAQGTTPWAATSWDDVAHHLGIDSLAVQPLTTAFRTPAPILALANNLLPLIAPTLQPAQAARAGNAPVFSAVVDRDEAVRSAIAEAVREPGSIGVFVPAGRLADFRYELGVLPESVTLMAAEEVKGLEFDTVILVEPAELTRDAGVLGLRRLYVALTRAVSHLVVIHTEDLPQELQAA